MRIRSLYTNTLYIRGLSRENWMLRANTSPVSIISVSIQLMWACGERFKKNIIKMLLQLLYAKIALYEENNLKYFVFFVE